MILMMKNMEISINTNKQLVISLNTVKIIFATQKE